MCTLHVFKRIKITRAKLVAQQRVDLPLMSKVKLKIAVRRRVFKPRTRVPKRKSCKKSNNSWYA